MPEGKADTAIVLAHGAGAGMNTSFIACFQRKFVQAGFPCLRFNFPYIHAGRRIPDPQAVLMASFKNAMEQMPFKRLVIGGKSMGGRIASYLAQEPSVAGLFFLGYPLHPPGKPDQLRDAHLYSIRKPMFFASGLRDPFAQSDLLQKTIEKIGKNVSSILIPDAGHSFDVPKKTGRKTSEVLELVANALLKWLKEV